MDDGAFVQERILGSTIRSEVHMVGDITNSVLRMLFGSRTSVLKVEAHIHAEIHFVVSVGRVGLKTDVVLVELVVAHIS